MVFRRPTSIRHLYSLLRCSARVAFVQPLWASSVTQNGCRSVLKFNIRSNGVVRSFQTASTRNSPNVVEATDANFEKIIKESKVPVIVDFYATWCGPCKMLAPVITKVVESANGKVKLIKIDVDDNTSIAAKYQIASLPTVAAFNNGKIVDQFIGLRNEGFVKGFVGKLIE